MLRARPVGPVRMGPFPPAVPRRGAGAGPCARPTALQPVAMNPDPQTPRPSPEGAGERMLIRLVLALFLALIVGAIYFMA